MKTLFRYVTIEMLVPFLIGTVAVVLMFDANLVIAFQKTLDLSSVPPTALAQAIIYKTPFFLNQTLPVGMALAGSLTMSRLARESELTAMRTAGASILKVVTPMICFGIVVAFLNYIVVEKVMPISEKKADELQRQIGILVASPSFAQNSYVQFDKYQVSIGSVRRNGPGNLALDDVLIVNRPQPGVTRLMQAPSGNYANGVWTLNQATIYQLDHSGLVRFIEKDPVTLNEKIVVEDLFIPPSPEQLTAQDLHKAIVQAREQGRSTRDLEINFQERFSIPAACIIFAFVSPILAVAFSRSGGFAGVLLSIFLVFLYYNVFVVSTDILGKNGDFSPIVAAWFTNVLFLAMGAFALWRLE